MKKLFTTQQYKDAKGKDKLPLQCKHCKKKFYARKKHIGYAEKDGIRCNYCSRACRANHNIPSITMPCKQCGIPVTKTRHEHKQFPSHFCSHGCSATYNNTHKTKGNRRSKLESWLEQELTKLYPKLHFDFNKKDAIDSELDIYIPSLHLAFELNGIFHYEPIFGKKKLKQIKNNDERKFQACIERNIEFCSVDVSSLKYFKPQNAQKYLDIICKVINIKT